MVNTCSVYGCSKKAEKGVRTLHEFPKDEPRLRAWKDFVNRTRACWEGPAAWERICSEHFVSADYNNYVRWTRGFSKKLALKRFSVPSVHPTGTCCRSRGAKSRSEKSRRKLGKCDIEQNLHMKNQTEDKSFKCGFCSVSCSQINDVKTHLVTHSEEKRFECVESLKCFSHKLNMKNYAEEKSFKCGFCSMSFSKITDVKTHLVTHSEEKRFKCVECLKCFSHKQKLKNHMRMHSREKAFKCGFCSLSFSLITDIKTHVVSHTGEHFKCSVCARNVSRCFRI